MADTFLTETEVLRRFRIDETLLSSLIEEEIICPLCREETPAKLFPSSELEKLRLAVLLVEEMGVNLPGVEIILHMRRLLLEMRAQFDDILEDLARQLGRGPAGSQ
ncbi:MAG: hypothetical protein JRF59_11575 [Deltaproteobacteria bacterium]|nr:hypothetical protein [Deltaproteobacteria bacterium]MBW1922372.1 hypothetical protein [Deltaproteobacteria bacterium]MBW1949847.1 hypothetical protein [Deltaproteobacteria bacterium]MBW2008403.1 hypothetical protein [Deltaproteobacteria bacterium]MBW2103953.1 hypothetical protein [Deltaproteobacteria bacterium]